MVRISKDFCGVAPVIHSVENVAHSRSHVVFHYLANFEYLLMDLHFEYILTVETDEMLFIIHQGVDIH